MRHPVRTAAFVLVAVALVAAAWVRIPYYAVGPGPAQSVTPLIDYERQPRYEPSGRFVMTTVRYFQVSPLQALWAWASPDWSIVPRSDLFAPGVPEDVQNQRSISQMDQSKIDATAYVLKRLDRYPMVHGRGALVEATVPDCPADGQLFPGDVIVAIDGKPVGSVREASVALDAVPSDRPIEFRVNVDGTIEHARFTRQRCVQDEDRRLVGVSLLNPFPFPVSIASAKIGGPSAGLMWALGLYDLMTPGDLTAGRTIAGTGTIDPRTGAVGPIGGIRDKVVAAERAGATIFLAPADNMAELANVDTGGMRVISVASFDEALSALRAAGSNA
ncbi:MAG TPA: S16 family serine protease [Actinomycetota bacterium]|nr:S16 family serine protease [Actinomycetota bacterium]